MVNFNTGCGILLAAMDGCRSCQAAATTVDVSRTFAVNMVKSDTFICVSSSPGLPQGVVVSFVLHATVCTVEHFVTALVNRFATLSPENRRNIHVARTALRKACLLTLYDHAQRFHCDQRCHLWLTGDEFRVCAASIWFISERVRPCGSKC